MEDDDVTSPSKTDDILVPFELTWQTSRFTTLSNFVARGPADFYKINKQ